MEVTAALENSISSRSFLQWGTRKRLRCAKAQVKQAEVDTEIKSTIRVDMRVVRADKQDPAKIILPFEEQHFHQIKSALNTNKKAMPCIGNNNIHSSSSHPEKSGRLQHPVNNIVMCTRRNSAYNTSNADTVQDNKASGLEALVWPKFVLELSHREKEGDFLRINGSKLPLRPKKRPKYVQRAIQNASPGCWLSDITQEWYEVREKKCMKKRKRGLKAMQRVESDSE